MIPDVTCKDIRDQMKLLAGMSTRAPITARRRPTHTRSADCYLTQSAPYRLGESAITFGPYARWLIAASLLAVPRSADVYLKDLVMQEGAKGAVNRIFTMSGATNKRLMTAHRYMQPTSSDREIDSAFAALLKKLNECYAVTRGSEISHAALVTVRVPISKLDGTIGHAPITWLQQWLQFGVGTPLPAELFQTVAAPSAQIEALPRSALLRIAKALHGLSLERVVNVHMGESPSSIAGYETPLRAMLGKPDGLDSILRSPESARAPARPVPVICVSLAPGASRHSIVRELYEKFCLDQSRLIGLERRAVDLQMDLDPVRHALTVNRVLLVFEGWDNFVSPFQLLRNYLCNSDWGECLRTLAQPHLGAWRAAACALPLRSVILVISKHAATELKPWAQTHKGGAHGRLVQGDRPAENSQAATVPASPLERQIDSQWHEHATRAALRLVAASVNGLRRDTLLRCLEQWERFFDAGLAPAEPAEREMTFQTVVDRLCLDYGHLVTRIQDEEVENLSDVQRAVELHRHCPRGVDADNAEESRKTRKIFTFVSAESRAAFVQDWLNEQPVDGSSAEAARRCVCSWAHISFVLSGESLAQATSQVRHMREDRIGSAYPLRRVVQAVFHGLMSLDIDERHFSADAVDSGGLFGPMLPVPLDKRYRFLYGELFRHMVEGDEWRLARAFGRSDLSLDLLTLFVRPSFGPMMLIGTGDTAPPAQTRDEIAAPLRTDPELWCEVIEALGRAACDLGGSRGDPLVKWALALLPGGEGKDGLALLRPEPGDQHDLIAAKALKLRVDWHLTRGDPQETMKLCWAKLEWLGITRDSIEALRPRVRSVVELLILSSATSAQDALTKIRTELGAALDSVLLPIKKKKSSGEQRETASAAIFRLAEALAEGAGGAPATVKDSSRPPTRPAAGRSTSDRKTPNRTEILDVACACVLFWIADRLRSDAAVLRPPHARWPRAGARATRAYVRTCLKLAQLLSEITPAGSTSLLSRVVDRLLAHAQSRQDLHTRHNFVFRREQCAMLALEANRIRAWVRVTLNRARPAIQAERERYAATVNAASGKKAKKVVPDMRWTAAQKNHAALLAEQNRLLDIAWNLLQEGEGHLLALGLQTAHVKRLWLERTETALSLAQIAVEHRYIWSTSEIAPLVEPHLRMARRWNEMLKDSSQDSPYWLQHAQRQWDILNRRAK